MSSYGGVDSVYTQLSPYTFVTESGKQADYQWKSIGRNPVAFKIEINDIALKQEPRETVNLKIVFSYVDHQNFTQDSLYEMHCQLKFHNNLHLFTQDYVYEVSCERAGMGRSLAVPIFTLFERRHKSSVEIIKKKLIINGLLYSEDLRFWIRRCNPNNLKENAKQDIDFESLLKDVPTDVSLQIEQLSLPAHKLVLLNKSVVFRAMFSNEMFEKRSGIVSIEEFNIDTVRAMLNFMYEGRLENDVNISIYDLYKAAHKYELHDLCYYCEEWILFHSQFENIAETLALIDLYEISEEISYLKKCMSNFVEQHESEMVAQPSFLDYLCQSMNTGNVVKTLLLASKYELEKVKDKAVDFIAQNYSKMNENEDFLQLFESHPVLTKNIYLFYTKIYGSKNQCSQCAM